MQSQVTTIVSPQKTFAISPLNQPTGIAIRLTNFSGIPFEIDPFAEAFCVKSYGGLWGFTGICGGYFHKMGVFLLTNGKGWL
jgi:hypothetical protein